MVLFLLLLIFVLLYGVFGSVCDVLIIFIVIFLLLIGGVLVLWVWDIFLLIFVGVGFIVLLGIVVFNGVVMFLYIKDLMV